MAVSVAGVSNGTAGATGMTSCNLPKPANMKNGDILIAVAMNRGSGSDATGLKAPGTPSGWTRLTDTASRTFLSRLSSGGSYSAAFFKRITDATNEPANYVFPFTVDGVAGGASSQMVVQSILLRGAHLTDTPVLVGAFNQASTTTHNAPPVQTDGDAGGLAVRFVGSATAASALADLYSWPSSQTERQEVVSGNVSGYSHISVATVGLDSAGDYNSTTTATWNTGDVGNGYIAYSVGVKAEPSPYRDLVLGLSPKYYWRLDSRPVDNNFRDDVAGALLNAQGTTLPTYDQPSLIVESDPEASVLFSGASADAQKMATTVNDTTLNRTSFCFAAWVKLISPAAAQHYGVIGVNDSSMASTGRFHMIARRNAVGNYFSIWNPSTGWVESGVTLALDTTYFLVTRTIGTTTDFFINGVKVATKPHPAVVAFSGARITVGNSQVTSGIDRFKGYIDEPAAWVATGGAGFPTDSQVMQMYQVGINNTTAPYVHMETPLSGSVLEYILSGVVDDNVATAVEPTHTAAGTVPDASATGAVDDATAGGVPVDTGTDGVVAPGTSGGS